MKRDARWDLMSVPPHEGEFFISGLREELNSKRAWRAATVCWRWFTVYSKFNLSKQNKQFESIKLNL